MIFISHGAEDGPLALRIAQGLEASGYTTWYYERDSLPGPSYVSQILHALTRSAAVVVVISPTSLASGQVDKEVVQAHEYNLPFLPLLHTVPYTQLRVRRPEWVMAFGAAVALPLPSDDVTPLLPRIVAGVRWLTQNGTPASARCAADETQAPPQPGAAPHAPAVPPLPIPPTPLVDREREIAALSAMARRPEVRLITLTGPGGVGKTRLALQVAATVSEDFADGVVFVALSSLSDARLVPTTIAHALGITEEGASDPLTALTAELGPQERLVVLDNFEQVIDAATVVAEVVASCPRLTVLVTSRAPLRLRGEHEIAVPPLTTPDLAQQADLAALSQCPAVALFVARAAEVKADFALTPATAPAVAEICTRLDGLPLALELAAARLRLFPPQALLARLSRRLTLLTGGARDLPERQRTLRATIDWSYDLLQREEQTLLARLGVFVGGATLEAVQAICDPEGTLDTLSGLEALLEQGLLRLVDRAGATRVTLLETIGEYARERLVDRGEEDALHGRHAAYYLAVAEEAGPQVTGPAQGASIACLEADHDNLRAALAWAHRAGQAEAGLRMAIALTQFWQIRSYLSEGRRWLETFLAATEDVAARDAAGGPQVQARALYEVSAMAYYQGDYVRAVAASEASVALYRAIGDTWGIAAALNMRAAVATGQGDYDRAAALYDESLAVRRMRGDTRDIAVSLCNLGNVALWQGELDRAAALHEESLALFRAVGDQLGMATVLNSLGFVAQAHGERQQATVFYEESLALAQELGDKRGIANALTNLGELALAQGDDAQARVLIGQGLGLFRETGDRYAATLGLTGCASVAQAQGHGRHAARLLGAVSAACEAMGVRWSAHEQGAFKGLVRAVRRTLGDEAFAAAWGAGRVLSLEHAIGEALEG